MITVGWEFQCWKVKRMLGDIVKSCFEKGSRAPERIMKTWEFDLSSKLLNSSNREMVNPALTTYSWILCSDMIELATTSRVWSSPLWEVWIPRGSEHLLDPWFELASDESKGAVLDKKKDNSTVASPRVALSISHLECVFLALSLWARREKIGRASCRERVFALV